MAFICGSFRSQEEDDIDAICPISSSSPRKPTRRRNIIGSRRSKNTTNPYSDRGLDKFEALMADLDQQRQKIMIQKGSEDVSMIKFIYRNSNEVKPIVVKIKDQRKRDSASSIESTLQLEQEEDVAFAKGVNIRNIEQGKMVKPLVHESKNNKIITGQWRKKIGEWWNPSYYFPLFLIMILVLLMFSGRSFAILCTSIGWYTVPIINHRLHSSKQSKNSRASRKKST